MVTVSAARRRRNIQDQRPPVRGSIGIDCQRSPDPQPDQSCQHHAGRHDQRRHLAPACRPKALDIFETGGSTYAAVASATDDGVQILDLTDPAVTDAGSITKGTGILLDGATDVAVFETGGSTYAAVTAFTSDGVQILNLDDPANITAEGNLADSLTTELNSPWGISVFEVDGRPYAAVAVFGDDRSPHPQPDRLPASYHRIHDRDTAGSP